MDDQKKDQEPEKDNTEKAVNDIINDAGKDVKKVVIEEPQKDKETSETTKKIINLVMSGGGIKGIAHLGALYALQQLKYLDKIEVFSGTSVGGLISILYIIGYTPAKLYEFIKIFDVSKTRDMSITNIFQKFGVDSGEKLEIAFKKMINKMGLNMNITLKELYEITHKKIILTTVCVNTEELCYVSHENYPDLPVYLAMRMTSSIPGYYCPVEYKGYLYIDGASMDNYPHKPFKDQLEKTMGLLLIDAKNTIEKIDNIETYFMKVLKCMMTGMDYHNRHGFEDNTIEIHVENINVMTFNIDDGKKDELFLKGFNAVMNYINK